MDNVFTINNFERIKHYQIDRFVVASINENTKTYEMVLKDSVTKELSYNIKLSRVINTNFKKRYGQVCILITPHLVGKKRRMEWVDKKCIKSASLFLNEITQIIKK